MVHHILHTSVVWSCELWNGPEPFPDIMATKALKQAFVSLGKVKLSDLYSALHGIQTTLKCSGMDYTVLPATNTVPALLICNCCVCFSCHNLVVGTLGLLVPNLDFAPVE